MPPAIATLVFALGIAGLFVLDRDEETRTSKALWIPVIWVLITGSRAVSEWLQLAPADASDVYLEGSPLDRYVFLGLLIGALIVLFARRAQIAALLRANGAILLYFTYCLASVLWSSYPDVAFKRWTKAVGDLVIVTVVLTDPEPLTAIKRVLTRAGFLLLPLSVLLIKYYPDLGRSYNGWTWTLNYTGVTTNKNMLGMVALIMGLGAEWRLLEKLRTGNSYLRTRHLIAHGILFVIAAWLLIVAHSATSLSCFVMAGAIIAVMSFFATARRSLMAHCLVIGVVTLSAFALFFDSGGSLVGSLGRDPTLTGRTEIWHVLLGYVSNPWWGTGYGSFWLGKRLYEIRALFPGNPLMEAHNGYVEVYLHLGWVGVLLLASVIVTGYRNVMAAFRRDTNLGTLRMAYFVVGVVYNLTEAAFKEVNLTWIFFLLAILATPESPFLSQDQAVSVQDDEKYGWAREFELTAAEPLPLNRF